VELTGAAPELRRATGDPLIALDVRDPEDVERRTDWFDLSVEVSIDGAGEWQAATLVPQGAANTWQDWSFEWTIGAKEIGRHVIRARATDASGATQPDLPEWNRLGYGNNAVQKVPVSIK